MGRGLSELQRQVLREAGTRQRVTWNLLVRVCFGWEETGCRIDQYKFSPTLIGKAEYRKSWAALSRSATRLENRGLLSRANWLVPRDRGRYNQRLYGVEITDKGRDWLTVNEVPKRDFINR